MEGFWEELNAILRVYSHGRPVIIRADVNAQPVPCVERVTGDVSRAGGAQAFFFSSGAEAPFLVLLP